MRNSKFQIPNSKFRIQNHGGDETGGANNTFFPLGKDRVGAIIQDGIRVLNIKAVMLFTVLVAG